jgi:hypothetical protein
VPIDASRSETVQNLAYVHAKCKNNEVSFIEADVLVDDERDIREVLETLAAQTERHKEKLKFTPLAEHIRTRSESRFSLTFDEIDKILAEPLCNSAHKYREYWSRRGYDKISECWLANGYKVAEIDLVKERVTLTRSEDTVAIILPPYLQKRVPPNCKAEMLNFFEHLKKKYGL